MKGYKENISVFKTSIYLPTEHQQVPLVVQGLWELYVHCSVKPPPNFPQKQSGRERSKLGKQSFWLVMLADLGMNCNWMMMLQGFIGFQDCVRDWNICVEKVFCFHKIQSIIKGLLKEYHFWMHIFLLILINVYKRIRKPFWNMCP